MKDSIKERVKFKMSNQIVVTVEKNLVLDGWSDKKFTLDVPTSGDPAEEYATQLEQQILNSEDSNYNYRSFDPIFGVKAFWYPEYAYLEDDYGTFLVKAAHGDISYPEFTVFTRKFPVINGAYGLTNALVALGYLEGSMDSLASVKEAAAKVFGTKETYIELDDFRSHVAEIISNLGLTVDLQSVINTLETEFNIRRKLYFD